MKAAIYSRYSAGPNQTDISIEGQQAACKKYIKEKGYSLAGSYADRHITGKTDKRPAFQEMISDAEAGKFEVLVVYTLDRFSRGESDIAYYKHVLGKAGVKIESATERIPDGPEGILLEKMLEGLAVYYSLELSRKIKRGMKTRAEKGAAVGGPVPFGYRLKDRAYEVKEDEAEAIEKCFRKIAEGESMADCARYLNAHGFRTNRGGSFGSGSVRGLLTNRKYIGIWSYDGIEIQDGLPAIVDPDLFQVVQNKIKDNKKHRPRGDFALTGKLICGGCGSYMRGTSGTSKTGKIHYYYRCPGKDRKNIPRDWLEHLIAEHVRGVLTAPQELASLIDKIFTLQQEENTSEGESELLKKKLASIDQKTDRAVDWILQNGPDFPGSDRIRKRLEDLEEERKAVEAQLQAVGEVRLLTKTEIETALRSELIGKLTDQEVIRDLVYRVTLYPDRIFLELPLTDRPGVLKSKEVPVFDQTPLWWSIGGSDRTSGVQILKGRVVLGFLLQ